MRFIQLAAIAITIIVAFPIGIGYMMSFDETEVTGWRSTDTVNLSDVILNSESEYYSTSTAPYNNAELISLSEQSATIRAPYYISVGSTVTSIPRYTQNHTTVEASVSPTTHYGAVPESVSVADGDLPTAVDAATIGRVMVSASISGGGDPQMSFTNSSITIDDVVDNWLSFYSVGSGFMISGTQYAMGDSAVVTVNEPVGENVYIYVRLCNWVSVNVEGDFASSVYECTLRLTTAEGIRYVNLSDFSSFARVGTTVYAGGAIYNNVSAIDYASYRNLDVYRSVQIEGSYADPSAGWWSPFPAGDWINGQLNSSVTMYFKMPSSGTVSFGVGDNSVEFSNNNGFVYVDGERFGKYSNYQLIFNLDGITVSGIMSWPSMYSQPSIISSKTIEWDNPLSDPFAAISITDITRQGAYRVDSASIVAGTFPSTLDYDLDIVNYWPDSSYALDFSNIGIFGDSITFGGRSYDITNGMITYDTANGSTTKRLIDVTFSATLDNGQWVYSINNNPQAEDVASRSLFLGGEWSATLMGYKMESYSETVTEWVPGEFGIDSDSFIVVGLFGCLATFVGLGFYGAKTGHKVLSLMIICGICAVVLILMA